MIGKKLSQYEIVSQIGVGGMGEVYRARDTRLGRDVAIKILPREMSGDPERVARFQREARTLASLQHANIAAVYGYEDDQGVRFLAMELVEGSNLAERLDAGPIAEDEAREITRKIAAGLDEAHRNGIMHRDLKPANVMLTADGEVKILDFGLARAYAGDAEDRSNPALSPTITAAMTQAGTVLGTAAYMSPEQARGRRVDHRADIWAMGAILFEMLAGRRLFEGETTTDILASVIKVEPDLDALPKTTRSSTRRMLRKCLQRDPRHRLHSAADAALEFDEAESTATPVAGRPLVPWVLAAVLGLALISQMVMRGENATPVAVAREYQLDLPEGHDPTKSYRPVVSPDGRRVVTLVADSFGHDRLHLRSLVDGSTELLSEDSSGEFPFWSPDSRFLGFFSAGRLRKLHLESGSVQLLMDRLPGQGRGGSWSAKDEILYAPGANTGLFLVGADGTNPRQITTLDTTLVDGSHRWPSFLPDGHRFIFTVWSNVLEERSEHGGIYISDLDGATPRRLLRDVSAAVLIPTGQLMFHRNGALMAVDFDQEAGTVGETPILVSDKVAFIASNGLVGASATVGGDLFVSEYSPSKSLQLAWVDRGGRRVEDVGPVLPLTLETRLSRTEKHYALELIDDVGSVEIWIGDVERGTRSRLSKFDSDCWGVQFSPDGREVAYCVQIADGGRLYRQEITGARDPEPILEFPETERVRDVSQWPRPDLMLVEARNPRDDQVGIQAINPETGEIRAVLMDDYAQRSPALSPDGAWLAYASQESGRQEIYVRSWPDLARKWRVSREGGNKPRWNRSGNRLQFLAASAPEVREVSFEMGTDDPEISLPRVVVKLPANIMGVEIAPDLDRYLIGFVPRTERMQPARVLVGWGGSAR